MAQLDVRKTALSVAALAAMVAAILPMSSAAGATSIPNILARNPNNFVLTLEDMKFIGGGWTGDANFTISACSQPSCFHLSGPIKIVSAPKSEVTDEEGFFTIPRTDCVIHFEEVPHGGMDSGDYRLTLLSKDEGAKGCSALPAGLAGVYRQET